jgi:pSer/pThr/pTyr-binding forkhead associated (FHA) protein
MMRYLLLRLPMGSVRIPIRGALVLGRANDCDVVFDDGQVSRQHCRLTPTASGVDLTDLSAYGTKVNDRAVDTKISLEAGDEIQLGPFRVIFANISDVHRPADDLSPARVNDQMLATVGMGAEEEEEPRNTVRLENPGYSGFMPVKQNLAQLEPVDSGDVAPGSHVTEVLSTEELEEESKTAAPLASHAVPSKPIGPPLRLSSTARNEPLAQNQDDLSPTLVAQDTIIEEPREPTMRISAHQVSGPPAPPQQLSPPDELPDEDPTPTEKLPVVDVASRRSPTGPEYMAIRPHNTPPDRIIDPSRNAQRVEPRKPSGEAITDPAELAEYHRKQAQTASEIPTAAKTSEVSSQSSKGAKSAAAAGEIRKEFHAAATKLLDGSEPDEEAMSSTARIPRPEE